MDLGPDDELSAVFGVILESAHDGVFVLDKDWRYLLWSDVMEDIFGIRREQVVGSEKKPWEIIPAIKETGADHILRRVMGGEALERAEARWPFPNGTVRYTDERYMPWRDGDGNVRGVIGLVHDITREKRLEADIRRGLELVEAVINIAPIVLFTLDEHGIFTMSKGKGLEALGLRPGEVVGSSVYDVYRDYPQVQEGVHRALAGHAFSETLRIDELIFDIWYAPLRRDGGPIMGVRGIAIDVTELKRREEAIHRRDRDIRQAYADVFCAVTNDKLVIMTPEELAGALGEPVGHELAVNEFKELQGIRSTLRRVLRVTLPDSEDVDSVVMAAGEAITNAVKHGTSCSVQVHKIGQTTQILVADHGPGIDFTDLPHATLAAGFSTKKSLGVGFSIMLEVCDRVLLSTGPLGTTVVLELGGREPAGSLEDILGRAVNV